VKGPHDEHYCKYGSGQQEAYWKGYKKAVTGYFDEPDIEELK
jgi:hypothetical protein